MTSSLRALLPVVILAVACGRGASDSAAISDDLRKDLEASAAERPELASATGSYQPMRFVSEIEQVNGAEPVQRTRAPRRVAAQPAAPVPEETQSPAPEVTQEVQVAEAPSEVQAAPAPESDAPRVPSVAPRPSALPVDVPTGYGGGGGIGTGRGEGPGVGIGDVIGVVIRGGGVGPDHCPPRRRGRPTRFPVNW